MAQPRDRRSRDLLSGGDCLRNQSYILFMALKFEYDKERRTATVCGVDDKFCKEIDDLAALKEKEILEI